jgi:hypothetical protein
MHVIYPGTQLIVITYADRLILLLPAVIVYLIILFIRGTQHGRAAH